MNTGRGSVAVDPARESVREPLYAVRMVFRKIA